VRRDYETGLWEDIARFVNPRREDIGQYSTYTKKGQRRGKDVYDGTPLGALNTWADGMQGFLVSESLTWFRSEMSNPMLNKVDEVRAWLQEYDRLMYAAFRRSNFYATIGEWFRDAGSIGTATLYTEEDKGNSSASHTCIHPREVFIAENKLNQVDTVFRKFELTARQAVQKFGKEKLSDAIKNNAEKHPSKMHEFVHAVFPNNDLWPGKKTAKGKKFRSVYVETEGKGETKKGQVVRDSGYDINPYAVWRLRKNSDEVYGYSQAADSIVEVFQLNQIAKTMTMAAQKAVEPPLNVPESMRGNVRMTPNGYNYYDNNKNVITPIQTGINYPIGIDQQERLQQSIEDKYRVSFFQMLTKAGEGRERTAREIIEMKSEQAVLMGPQVDRLTGEGLAKVFRIVSDIEDRAGRFEGMVIPDVVLELGGSIDITFTGPLAQAQKELFEMQPIQRGINAIAPIAQVFPNILDRVNEDEMAEAILEASAFPQKLIRTDEEVAEIREQRAAAQQQQMQQQMMLEAADRVPKLSKEIEPNSPIEALTNAG
jgi:hypothetical protein